ncbi:MAG: lysozyme inhibitor LprI family protein [Janthinobacterium lividum]
MLTRISTTKSLVLSFSLFLLITATTVYGQKLPAKGKIDCSKATSQTELNICAQQQFTAADGKLNAVYKRVLAKLNQKSKQALIKAQREWVQFRDDNALAFAGQYEGGSMQPMVSLDAKTATTRSRTNELQKLLKDQ